MDRMTRSCCVKGVSLTWTCQMRICQMRIYLTMIYLGRIMWPWCKGSTTPPDQQIRHLESKLASGEAAYDEKEARMLGTIARTLDKLMELTNVGEATASKTGQTGHKSKAGQKSKRGAENSSHDEKAIDDAVSQQSLDDLRADLAQRLEALQQGAKSPVPVRPEQA